MPISATTPIALPLVVYRGVGSAVAAAGSADSSTATHLAPAASVTAAGSWVASFWADKSSTTTGWSPPSALAARDTTIGTGGVSTKGVNLTVILAPQS